MAPPGNRERAILLLKGDAVGLRLRGTADYLCVLHDFRKAPTDSAAYTEGTPLAEYEIRYADGATHVQAVRARFELPIPESPGPAHLSVPFQMPITCDPAAVAAASPAGAPAVWHRNAWGIRQAGIGAMGGSPLLYALRNPHPEKRLREIVLRGLVDSPILVAGITAYAGTDHPLRHLPRRMYRVRLNGAVATVQRLSVDMGVVAREDRTLGPRGRAWLASPYTGVTQAEEPEKGGESVFSIVGARDATVLARLAGRRGAAGLSLGEAYETGSSSSSGDVRLERLGGRRQWMEVEVLDASTGRPTPTRIHFSGAAGEYLAPYGHHEQINPNWFEDYGADVRVGNRNYAYVPGRFTTDLPAGDLYVELFKGFEYVPTRLKVAIRPGQKTLTLRIDRWKDLRAGGWVTADTHVHFISPHTAWLEAQCEGVNVVNLLASQWGRLFTNVGDITGRVGVTQDDTLVWVGTENRNHMLGHISMLGTQGLPVYPMCGGGITESWVGDPDYRTLTEWAQECRRKEGLVVRPHFPFCGFTEDPVLAVLGVVDALEIRVGPDANFPLQEWYRYLNSGYRVAVAGGTDKMGAQCALGQLRTYARIDRNRALTFENWAQAVRAGRTFATTGPLLDLKVDGVAIGDTLRLPPEGGFVQVDAVAESAWPLGRIELVQNGRVAAGESSRGGARRLAVSARLPCHGSGWIAARCSGAEGAPSGYMAAHTSPVYVACGRHRPFDGPAVEHMLTLTRGGIEYLETLSTRLSDRDHARLVRLYRQVERHLHERLHQHRRPHTHP